jgi:hypothetical protein
MLYISTKNIRKLNRQLRTVMVMNSYDNFEDKLRNYGKTLFYGVRKLLDKYGELAIWFELAGTNYTLATILAMNGKLLFVPIPLYCGILATKHGYKEYMYRKKSGYYDYVDKMYQLKE